MPSFKRNRRGLLLPSGVTSADYTASTFAELQTLLHTTVPTSGGKIIELTADITSSGTIDARVNGATSSRRFDSPVIIRSAGLRKTITSGSASGVVSIQGGRNIEFQDLKLVQPNAAHDGWICGEVVPFGTTQSQNVRFRNVEVEGTTVNNGTNDHGRGLGFRFRGGINCGLIECTAQRNKIANFCWFFASIDGAGAIRGSTNYAHGCFADRTASDMFKVIGNIEPFLSWNEWPCGEWATLAHADFIQCTVETDGGTPYPRPGYVDNDGVIGGDNRLQGARFENNCMWHPQPEIWRGQGIFLTGTSRNPQAYDGIKVRGNVILGVATHAIDLIIAVGDNVIEDNICPRYVTDTAIPSIRVGYYRDGTLWSGVIRNNQAGSFVAINSGLQPWASGSGVTVTNADAASTNTILIMTQADMLAQRDLWRAQRALQTWA